MSNTVFGNNVTIGPEVCEKTDVHRHRLEQWVPDNTVIGEGATIYPQLAEHDLACLCQRRGGAAMKITKEALVLILAGGVGSRLNILVQKRAKPAVPFGGIYRIIDFSLSNVMNSGLKRLAY